MSFKEVCYQCESITGDKLVQIFPTWNSDIDHASMWVCRSCLVGAMIPVIRPSTEKWEFGTVEQAFWQANHESKTINPKTGSDDPSKQHFLRFMDSKCEWAIVETTPYDHYIDFYKKRACPPVLLGHNLQISSFGDDGGADMDGSDDDDDYEHESVPRRLEKSFETISDVDFTSIDQQPPMKMVTTPHRILAACSPVPYRYQILPSGNSVASSLSISTAFIERSGSLDHSPFATPTKISPRGREGDSTTTSPKYSQKLWTPEEDRILLEAVSMQSQVNLKWSMVAKVVPGRSGKQCRERYLNHLTPNIKLKNWSPVEDAVIFRLYHTDGSKWSMMSKLIRGRTDNGIKNRYHHLKRRLERQVHATPTSLEVETIITRLEQSVLLRDYDHWMLKYVATQSLLPSKKINKDEAKGYLREGCDELCSRCGLFVPSVQTGQLVCKTTGWCEVCVRLSPCLSGDLLRVIDDARTMTIGD